MALLDEPPALSWRIPGAAEAQTYRIGLLQILVGTLFFGVLVFSVAPNLLLPAVVATVPLLIFLLWRNGRRPGPKRARPDNVRLDERGLTWIDEVGQEHRLAREQIEAFRIAPDADTLRPVEALLLRLTGGFESQPIELHPPADAENVRRVLASKLAIREQTPAEVSADFAAARVPGIDFQLADDGAWELKGSRADLLRLCDRLAAEAPRLKKFPAGSRPLRLTLDGETLQLSPCPESAAETLDAEFHGSAEQLLAFAARVEAKLQTAEVGDIWEIPVFDKPEAGLARVRVR